MAEHRIAHVINTMGHGGVPRVAYALLDRLPPAYDRRLYCLSARARDASARDRLVRRLEEGGVRVRFADASGARAAGEQVAAWVGEDGVDLVHTHSTKPNRYARAAVLRDGAARVVAHYHNEYDDKWADPDALQAERDLGARSDGLVACSQAVRAHVADRLGQPLQRITLVRNGVRLADYRSGDGWRLRRELGLAAGTPLVGTIGRISRQKAPLDVLHAARRVLDRVPEAVFLLVGDTDDEELSREVRAQAHALGLGDRLRLLGHREDVADVYAALDVFVLASHWEGFGLVLVEAMAAGTPVVATRVGAVPEVTGTDDLEEGGALLVPPGRPDELAAGVVRLLEHPVQAHELAARGRQRAEEFGWERPTGELDLLYRTLLARAGARSSR